jgi:RNA polymerase sigma-70 factor (ECF subfamily)
MNEGFFHLAVSTKPPPPWTGGRMSVPGQGPAGEILAGHIRAVALSRDRAAFAALFDHFAPRVKSYMLRLGAGAGQAEDLAQETLLTVWRKADRFDPALASAATWVFTVARNLRIDALRRERIVESGEPSEDMASEDPGAETLMQGAQAERGLRAALASLPEDQALLVRLSFFEDHAHGDISRRLGLPLGTVKSRLRRALLRLRAALEELQ